LRRRYNNIRKLWAFILFFLTKRQMFIPLVYMLAKSQEGFDSPKLEELLNIRQHCREKSLKHSPHQRLALEKKVSQTLFEYFSFLENQKKLQMQSKFGHIVRDLEFIDSKLVELQQLYNVEAKRWNRLSAVFMAGFFFQMVGMNPFDLFSE
ncbi:MAG TPA: LemA family protein, partial [Candidatus Gracilibacteria bacterium]